MVHKQVSAIVAGLLIAACSGANQALDNAEHDHSPSHSPSHSSSHSHDHAMTLPGHTHEASAVTIAANRAFSETLPWDNDEDEELSERGFIATREDPVIRAADGRVVWDLSAYDFAEADVPDTANPSLWRHLRLLRKHGLFEVAPGIWQIRGFDLSVMSIMATDTGYVVVDPLLSTETAAAGMELVREHLGDKPVHAVIYTHSHADHYAGVKGVVSDEDVASGRVEIIAPHGFMEHTVSETLVAGPAMSRRSAYQFGTTLEKGPKGEAGNGIGPGLALGTMSLIAPTIDIVDTGTVLNIDGLIIEFQVTPGTEAPVEFNFFLPQKNALCLAENANVTMHNILTPRGALVRDAKAWSHYLTEAQRIYGARSNVLFNSHGWPRWGADSIVEYIGSQRDTYKFLHDQSVRLMNQGYTEAEIAEQIRLPNSIASNWYNRGYYGTTSHNSKAVYQRYLGWYDGNPVNLNPWPPEELGARYVDAMGGPGPALKVAADAFEAGDYRWSSQVASHIVFADDTNTEAREMLARSLEQMGYQAEGMLWRNMYLTGAKEARKTPESMPLSTVVPEIIETIDSSELFELLAVRVDPAKAEGQDIALRFVFPERDEDFLITLRNSVFIQQAGVEGEVAATITLPRQAFIGMLFAGLNPADLAAAGTLQIEGDRLALMALLGSLDPRRDGTPFPIVTP